MIYPDLLREFYVNLYVDKIDDKFDDLVLKLKEKGVEVYVNEELLCRLFSMNSEEISVRELSLGELRMDRIRLSIRNSLQESFLRIVRLKMIYGGERF